MRGVPLSGVWSEGRFPREAGIVSASGTRSERATDRKRSEGEAPREPGSPAINGTQTKWQAA
jgi:hypothetical protein